MSSVRLCVI